MTEPRRSRRPPAGPVVWGSFALFAVLFVLLSFRVEAEGSGTKATQNVQVRKILERRVVTHVVEPEEEFGAETETPESVEPTEAGEPVPPVEPEPVEPVVTSSS